ncbi:MAG: TauD/TfdA family dioxygenase [Hyphomonas sp.]|nr:TauD/TfdA family dioxygenase [Hyphomonas sp.]
MSIDVIPTGKACGAMVRGLDLAKPLSDDEIVLVRRAWLEHHVLAFSNQKLDGYQLEAFASQFGEFGEDPFFNPIPGRTYTAAIKHEANETNLIFADRWHSDWSFLETPPACTILYSLDVAPHGGDTHFSNQHKSFEAMPEEMRRRFDGLKAIHSPKPGYTKGSGVYGDRERMGSMDIKVTEEAADIFYTHPLAPAHPETGRQGSLSGISYIVGFDGVENHVANQLILELNDWQNRDGFVYKHKWGKDMLVMWDNCSVAHKAIEGYEDYRRELHRVTLY